MASLSIKPEDWLTPAQLEYLKDHMVMTDSQLAQLRSQIYSLTDINVRLRAFKNTVIRPAHRQDSSSDKQKKDPNRNRPDQYSSQKYNNPFQDDVIIEDIPSLHS